MKTRGIPRLGAVALVSCAQILSATAVTFTQDTFISFGDFSHEGQDVVVTNCTLTVDGPHIFRSLEVQNGAVLTHSPNTNGPQQFTFLVSNEPHVMSATNPATLYSANVDVDTIAVFNVSRTALYTENVDYVVTLSNQFVQLTLTTNSSIAEGATVLVNYDWAETLQGFVLYINNDVNVRAGGAIDVSGKGYGGGSGVSTGLISGGGGAQITNYPFVFTAGGGGGHGGAGGISSTSAHGGTSYGSTTNPATLGSGGGFGSTNKYGGAGGGSATILIGGNFQIDGQVLASGFRGTNGHSGGGAGGSLFLSAETFSGSGTIAANGGSGDTPDGGGGGGGRIAMYFATNNFTGSLTAFGGGGSMAGGAGTIYQQADADSAGRLFIVNGGKRGTNTTFAAAIVDFTVSGGAIAQAPGTPLNVTNLFVGSNSWVVAQNSTALVLNVIGDATVEGSGAINADFNSGAGPGAGSASCGSGSGGSYGGPGGTSACGASVAAVYGTVNQPMQLGSPGAFGTRAGGAVTMTVGGTLSLAGTISANGAVGALQNAGGGSGGSVSLTVGNLSGTGSISANGGPANNLLGGGGGGGRVAIYYASNIFTGSITAYGGAGNHAGGPGSIYLKSGSDPIPQIVFDNGGVTALTYTVSGLSPSVLTISGGTVLSNFLGGDLVLRSLTINSNSWYATPASAGGFAPGGSFTVTATNVTIQLGGGIKSDGVSIAPYPSGGGAGNPLGIGGGGGGGAGFGGAGSTNTVPGGFATSSSFSNPASPGGMGGAGSGPGGFGGGRLSLTVPGTLQLDGKISANGLSPSGFNAGGGGGGSILLSAGKITGAGSISANGGAAAPGVGGGGGGGAIALFTDTNLFSGSISAFGGAGTNSGGAGTIYFANVTTFLPQVRQLLIDNGGTRGARTPLPTLNDISDLTITGGASVSNGVTTLAVLRNLLVGSNSVLQFFLTLQPLLSVSSNVTVLAGGSINVDGLNQGTGNGGQTLNGTGGGGGGGGGGGASALGAAGGTAISDSITSPKSQGGLGGSGAAQGGTVQSPPGGKGGGALQMTIGNTLRVDGRISADGATSAAIDAGGGGGGSVLLSAKVFSGSGIISANGGAGNVAGGGGGGGHIAISYTSNLFSGNFTARGGIGANAGGAGTIYTSTGPSAGPAATQLILDNGGIVGGYTPLLTTPQSVSLTITGGAILSDNFSGSFTLQNLFIGSNSTWLPFSTAPINLTVLTNATIQSGGLFSLDGVMTGGPAPGQGLGNRGGGGGGHGGYGGSSFSNALGGTVTSDSITSPTGLGSQGGSGNGIGGGYGGGVLQMMVRGTFQVDGRISANGAGTNQINSGGGSGGSVFLQVGKLTGAGSISANGGAANNLGGGGGGGRVAVWYNTNLFTGAITALGGAGANFGGPGTVYLNPSMLQVRNGRVIFDNGGARGTNSAILTTLNQVDVVLTNGASVSVGIVSGFTTTLTLNNLIIASNCLLNAASNVMSVHLNISSNVDIQTGGALLLDGQGSRAIDLFGPAISTGIGGGHGGMGSRGLNSSTFLGGSTFDSINAPTLPGSGGGSPVPTTGSAGGGAIQLTVAGALNVNGVISANGTSATTNGAGGGAGGSVWLSAGKLSGSGRISTDGGSGDGFISGGGGGGRIALTFNTNQFTGIVSAHGGAGALLAGGAGTLYVKTNFSNTAQVIVENGGANGTNTTVTSDQLTIALSIRNGAVADSVSPLNLQGLLIDSGGKLMGHATKPTITVNVTGNTLVDTNGAIVSDMTGWNPGAGPGSGGVDLFGDGSGGGYGGAGGASFYGASGGGTYGSSNAPVDLGSAGGVSPPLAGYSTGGGAIRLVVNGALTVNGNISANGTDGFIDGSGGGAGGSIWITASNFLGNGWLTVNGGAGESFEGGGGGGGRIAIYSPSNFFSGNLLALGGDGTFPGQNGTIYTATSVMISGNITDTKGAAIAGITLQPSGLVSVMSDINGAYSVALPVFWSGSVTPNGSGIIVPSVRNYSALAADSLNQNFVVAATPETFNLSGGQFDGTNVTFSWYGISGANYQVQYSTDLVDWFNYGSSYNGGNAPISITVPPTNAPQMYFRLNTTY